jgi:hypothetical protein
MIRSSLVVKNFLAEKNSGHFVCRRNEVPRGLSCVSSRVGRSKENDGKRTNAELTAITRANTTSTEPPKNYGRSSHSHSTLT